jgi:hypothetical protein
MPQVSLCSLCGRKFHLLANAVNRPCAICGSPTSVRYLCESDHAICASCFTAPYLTYIAGMIDTPGITRDPIEAFLVLRRGYAFPIHGPEHHALVAAALLFAYHRCTGEPSRETIFNAIQQAAVLPMGSCGIWGACSAALGVGVAYGTILQATPMQGAVRGAMQHIVANILGRIGEYHAPRCCRRETLTALQVACEESAALLPITMVTQVDCRCDQAPSQVDCLRERCPFYAAEQMPTEILL